MELLKEKICLIKQDKDSMRISSLKTISSEKLFSEISIHSNSFIDCDLDSVLSIGKYELADLKEVLYSHDFSFSGLLPVVTIDLESKVLMQAYLNLEALSETFKTGYANYFSRSRNKIWLKGESSDNKQKINKVFYSEQDSFFVYSVSQNLAACHEGFYSCFFRKINTDGSFEQIDFDRKFKPEKVYG
jgi:phosphoribosyl-AMP cyclohydrolase